MPWFAMIARDRPDGSSTASSTARPTWNTWPVSMRKDACATEGRS